MTRKDYKFITEAIRNIRESLRHGMDPYKVIDNLQKGIAIALAKDNPRFNEDKFNRACKDEMPNG